MNIYRIILFQLLFLSGLSLYAQDEVIQKPEGSNINQFDEEGERHGMWLNKVDVKRGEPAYNEFGNYIHGDKTGPWYKLNHINDLIAIENYKFNVLDGEVKYYTKGVLTCIGTYKGLNPSREIDTIVVEDPVTGRQELATVRSERGTVRHGTWRFFDEQSGSLKRIEVYQVDDLIYHKDITRTPVDSTRNAQTINATINQKKDAYYRPPVEKQIEYTK